MADSAREERLLRRQLDPIWEDISEGSGIPARIWEKTIDLDLWEENNTTPIQDKDLGEKELTTYFARYMMEAIWLKLVSSPLRISLAQDFQGWTQAHFAKVNRAFLKRMLKLLHDNSIEISEGKGSFADIFVRVINEPTLHIRTEEFVPSTSSGDQIPTPTQQTGHTTDTKQQIPLPDFPQRIPSPESVRQAPPIQVPPANNTQTIPQRPLLPLAQVRYDLPPQRIIYNGVIDPHKVSAFQKGWRKERNYTGRPYDILYDKVKIFIGLCRRLQISEDQYYAVFPDILSDRAEEFYLHHIGPDKRWDEIYYLMDTHFNTNANHNLYYTDWTTTTFARVRRENPDKTLPEVLTTMLDKLALIQKALGNGYQGEVALRTTVTNACKGVPELEPALINPKHSCEEFFSDLRSSLQVSMDRQAKQYLTEDSHETFYNDRRYISNHRDQRGQFYPGRFQSRDSSRSQSSRGRSQTRGRPFQATRFARGNLKCFVCKKVGCWSTNHPKPEFYRAKTQFLTFCEDQGEDPPTDDQFAQYLTVYEGDNGDNHSSDDEEDKLDQDTGEKAVQFLTQTAFFHRTTGEDIYQEKPSTTADQFILSDHYRTTYQGELWDTGAARFSTVGKAQAEAYLREFPRTKVNWQPGNVEIRFGSNPASSAIGTIEVENQLGSITYHILDTATPFLLSLHDADRLKAYFNNVQDVIVREDGSTIPVVRKWGHPFFNTGASEAGIYLTEAQLRRIHRRFGHPRTERLYKLLKNAGHSEIQESVLEEIRKFCHHCQSYDPAPQRFKFSIKDECHFNYEIVIDIMYIDGKPVLHVIDTATSFQAAVFLKSLSARDTWDALCRCWIYTYQGPPDNISHDPGTNFASEEFRNNARIIGVSCEEMPVEAHWAIGKIERSHEPLKRAFNILYTEIGSFTDKHTVLQMAVKALNDTAGPNGIVPTLLVFGAYPRINQDSPPSPEITKRAEAVRKAMRELREIRAQVDVNRAINTRNGPALQSILTLPLKSKVMVWRENKGWTGPYDIEAIEGHNIMVTLPSGPTKFRATQVKAYHEREDALNDLPYEENDSEEDQAQDHHEETHEEQYEEPHEPNPQELRISGRSRRLPRHLEDSQVYLSKKEEMDRTLTLKLRQDGIITTPGEPFEQSDMTEINDLIAREVFHFIRFNPKVHGNQRIYKTRLVREVKGKGIKPYEKSRLVVQGYGDEEKDTILTQSPTIQRMSQRLILALGPSLIKHFGAKGELRDITQAYIQAGDQLTRQIFARLPTELEDKFPRGTIMKITKPLYGLAESGLYWFKTYHSHHKDKLKMKISSYDPCLLFTFSGPLDFGITGLQTDDTFSFATPIFSEREETELQEAKLRAKPKTFLAQDQPIEFNGGKIQLDGEDILLQQKGQSNRLELIDTRTKDSAQRYIEQRARGAYIASTCQPEAAFDLSIAAQIKEPKEKEIQDLNARVKWQIDNKERGLKYIPLNLARAKLFIFTDGSFANNKDLSSQLGFLIILAEERTRTTTEFEIQGNIIHWSSTKCKRVTRSVLASELYGMMTGFDSGVALSTTLQQITACLQLPRIPVVICSDSKSLYECLVKLGTTTEKRLMIDIMSLRESYEKREISEIRRIDGRDNPGDALTKKSPNTALEKLVSTNRLVVRVEAFVDRISEQKETV